MKQSLLTLLVAVILFLIGCSGNSSTQQQQSAEELFYTKLDSLKLEYSGKAITINKKKFSESVDPITSVFLYTSADKDNLAGKVLTTGEPIHQLSAIQISSYEYPQNDLNKNLMVQVESLGGRYSGQEGWISIEHIQEFSSLAYYIDQLK